MYYFISKTVSKEGRDLVFGDMPDGNFIIMEDDWTLVDVLKTLGADITVNDEQPIPRGFSQFETEDPTKENIYILNV